MRVILPPGLGARPLQRMVLEGIVLSVYTVLQRRATGLGGQSEDNDTSRAGKVTWGHVGGSAGVCGVCIYTPALYYSRPSLAVSWWLRVYTGQYSPLPHTAAPCIFI